MTQSGSQAEKAGRWAIIGPGEKPCTGLLWEQQGPGSREEASESLSVRVGRGRVTGSRNDSLTLSQPLRHSNQLCARILDVHKWPSSFPWGLDALGPVSTRPYITQQTTMHEAIWPHLGLPPKSLTNTCRELHPYDELLLVYGQYRVLGIQVGVFLTQSSLVALGHWGIQGYFSLFL